VPQAHAWRLQAHMPAEIQLMPLLWRSTPGASQAHAWRSSGTAMAQAWSSSGTCRADLREWKLTSWNGN